MFSTFTGNSRRPRNVNLSGQAGNPFSNTSWTPSTASNATKTVSNAQADRERRQAERHRLQAANQIQRVWRGHRARQQTHDTLRRSFDILYQEGACRSIDDRLTMSYTLLRSFYAASRIEDRRRLLQFVRDCRHVGIANSPPVCATPRRRDDFVQLVLDTLNIALAKGDAQPDILNLLDLAIQLLATSHSITPASAGDFFEALATLCQSDTIDSDSSEIIIASFSQLLTLGSNQDSLRSIYDAVAFRFLTRQKLTYFENNIALFSSHIDVERLASAILDGYARVKSPAHDDLLWLLSHFVSLGDATHDFVQKATYLEALYLQLTALSKDISPHLGSPRSSDLSSDEGHESSVSQHLDPVIQKQLMVLVSPGAISNVLNYLPAALQNSSSHHLQETSLLAGYISTLLACFPGQADEIRMRLFLESIPTPEGDITTVRLFWRSVRESDLFNKLYTQSQPPEDVLRDYVQGQAHPSRSSPEEQQWRVIVIFLELYIFVLRLSDDEDFFGGIKPQLSSESSSTSRIRASSLPLQDLKLLTVVLKNAAFALHYKAHHISHSPSHTRATVNSRLSSYLGSSSAFDPTKSRGTQSSPSTNFSSKLDIGSLKDLITTAMKMLHERDSRKHFLPAGHWLMTDKLDREDFVSAVIAEDERQRQEDAGDESSSDDEDAEWLEQRLTPLGVAAVASSRTSYNAGLQRVRQNQRKLQKERRLAEMGPKLEILKHMPFVVPFETRVKIFRQFINLDRMRRDASSPRSIQNMMTDMGSLAFRHPAHIRRGRLFEDAFDNFYKLGDGLKDPINITFVDQFGSPEAGIDGGGVTKEFLTSVTNEAFGGADSPLRMFASSEMNFLYPNPIAVDSTRDALRRRGRTESDPEWRESIGSLLKRYEFLGRVMGKCLYEGILIDLAFAGFFLLQWPSAGSSEGNTYKGNVNDLSEMDEELYTGMLRLKNYPGDVSALGIDFTISDQVSLPHEPLRTITRNLVPNGDKINVTNDNRLLYISYVARHRLVLQPALQTAAFLRGLREIIRPSWLSMFNLSELQHLVGGDSTEIDIGDLRRNTVYGGLYEIGDDGEEHPTIKLFWKVMAEFNDSQRRELLKYVSSTPRAPLLGFSQLRPKFSIRDAGNNEQRLPSASTCVNLLKLPCYKSETTMREKLLYAISAGAGFDLS